MSLYKLPTAIRHARGPYATNLDLLLATKEMQRDAKVDWPREVEQVVQGDRKGDDERLRDFRAVDPCENIDAVCGKGREEGHIEVVERTWSHSM